MVSIFPYLAAAYSLDHVHGSLDLNCTDGDSTANYRCSYAPISREGWAVYDDAQKYAMQRIVG